MNFLVEDVYKRQAISCLNYMDNFYLFSFWLFMTDPKHLKHTTSPNLYPFI